MGFSQGTEVLSQVGAKLAGALLKRLDPVGMPMDGSMLVKRRLENHHSRLVWDYAPAKIFPA